MFVAFHFQTFKLERLYYGAGKGMIMSMLVWKGKVRNCIISNFNEVSVTKSKSIQIFDIVTCWMYLCPALVC